MANINLLPWREQLREEHKKEFFMLLGFTVFAVFTVLVLIHLAINTKIHSQLKINELFDQEIAVLEMRISEIENIKEDKQELIARMEVINRLQALRPAVVHLFDEIVRILPGGVFITQVDKQSSTIALSGKAESNTRVSELMLNIQASEWLDEADLIEIKNVNQDGGRIRDFELQMQQKFGLPQESVEQSGGLNHGT